MTLVDVPDRLTSVYKSLTPRWATLLKHQGQVDYYESAKRFIINHSGRRSGKTEIAKRRIVRDAITFSKHTNGRFVCSAPTQAQSMAIFWNDLVSLSPAKLITDIIKTPTPTIKYVNGSRIEVSGLDKPSRVEGPTLDGIVIDEYGNIKAEAWTENVRPALSTRGRPGWALFIGVPEGRNHYYDLVTAAKLRDDWDVYHWPSAEVIPEEAKAAEHDLDSLSYMQEYGGEFISFAGRAYYAFSNELNANGPLKYNPEMPLVFCFDFNKQPGVAAVCQELPAPPWLPTHVADTKPITHVITEVWIDRDSNTEKVSKRLLGQWSHHQNEVFIYGDATGGAAGSAKLAGSDWDIVESVLRPHFGIRLRMNVPKGNPRERVRMNAVNSRLRAVDGTIRCVLDKTRCRHLIRDLEGVGCTDAGEIEKEQGSALTHISDALGYYVERKFPVRKRVAYSRQLL